MNESGQTEVSVRVKKKPLEKRFAPKSAAAFGLTSAQNFVSIQPVLLPSHYSQSVFLGYSRHLSHSTL